MKDATTRGMAAGLKPAPTRGLRIRVIAPADSVHTTHRVNGLRRLGHEVELLHCTWRGPDGADEPPTLLGYARRVLRGRPDITLVYFAHSYGGWLAAIGGARPLVVTLWGGDLLFAEQHFGTPISRWITRELVATADLVVVPTHHLMQEARRFRPAPRPVELVPWGVDLGLFRPADGSGLRRELGIPAGAPVVLSPRLLQPFYNAHMVVAALPRVVAHFPDVRLVLGQYMADQEYRAALTRQAESLGLASHVVFAPLLPTERMPELFSLAAVVVAVPPSDGLPLTMLEAMACGVPNVMSDLERYREVTADGALYVAIEPEAIASGILRTLEDAGLRDRLVATGLRIVAERGSLARELREVEALLQQLVSSPRRPHAWWTRLEMTVGLLALQPAEWLLRRAWRAVTGERRRAA